MKNDHRRRIGMSTFGRPLGGYAEAERLVVHAEHDDAAPHLGSLAEILIATSQNKKTPDYLRHSRNARLEHIVAVKKLLLGGRL